NEPPPPFCGATRYMRPIPALVKRPRKNFFSQAPELGAEGENSHTAWGCQQIFSKKYPARG
ncbi:hypothetical protein, partial [Desulfovibrio sp.]|uniref:hypothetical protein n=1 Tax=Desulfovibrio sp. TaxID=885 RepID=UPI0023C8258A